MRLKLAGILVASIALAACSKDKEVVNTPAPVPVPDCVFADGSNRAAPQWVCGTPVEGVALSAVGYSEKSAAGPNYMKQMAATAARVELAQVLSLDLQNMVKQYVETTGAGDAETVDRVNSVVTKQVTDQTLIGSKVIRQMPTPSGGLVVLVGLDPEQAGKVAQDILRTSMKNEEALYQKLEAEKGFEELASEIAARRAK
ncbi:LPP20 family lipoprotein [Marinomonas transparens]|uniref:LPP20 family lipoprotein n=1 Tax=Marinomonas transparens TaxID=2795388 RepID=A0A934JU08_9GAMM|nr:LPP20 family lipoprotein [Marinomonas transparens]MBJ7537027.1 LPP20 family lipoprotein [Marinomonas transparens]